MEFDMLCYWFFFALPNSVWLPKKGVNHLLNIRKEKRHDKIINVHDCNT